MKIKNIFARDLFRPINGVVKADQQDESVVFQELNEYVVTHELDKHFHQLFDAYLAAKDNPKDPVLTSRMGVWISGFFGSGKSHFIKILSYLLKNRRVKDPDSGDEKNAIEFFEEEVDDAMLLGDIKRAISTDTDVVLFNIDSKASSKDGRDAILKVFLRVFNELQGFCGDHPHIAEMERYLAGKGLLDQFHQAFKETYGADWLKERDAYSLMRDEVVNALAKTLNQSTQAAQEWFDRAENNYNINIEKFAKQVRDYLDSKGPDSRIIFLADEIGQFIGSDEHLMLNLQTITEDLGRICNGRAWVIVTSQEDIDAVLGEVRGARANDFSKIQGRFNTRLSLSSANTDEVIQRRLLYKTEDAKRALEDIYNEKGDILKNQISFSGGPTLKNYRNHEEFILNYPFAPYHFQLIQKIFESIRKVGATGLHLSRGERSMLDAFQLAAKNISEKTIGSLVPLYEFYPAIESFLDTSVKRTIEQASDNSSLQPFDTLLLKVLFLIRYLDIIKSSVDNLVTLCIDEVDADRFALKEKIEESLHRLEKQTLINRNGDLYFFLTNEERDVSREIKNVDISSAAETKLLSELIFDEVLKGDNKHRYQVNKSDYGYNRICDGYAPRVDQELTLEIISPFSEDYPLFNNAKCIQHSTEGKGRVLLKLPDNKILGRELRILLQTENYIRLKSDAAAPPTLKRILSERAEENRERRGRLISNLENMVLEADYYAIGQSLETKAASSRMAINEALNYLISNVHTKLGYIKSVHDDPQKEIKAVLLADDVGQYTLELDDTEPNAAALKEIIQFVDLSSSKNHKIYLNDLVERFTKGVYGWPEWEIVFLVSRLFMAGELVLKAEGDSLTAKEAIQYLTKGVKWKQVSLIKKKATDSKSLSKARNQGQKLFGQIGPDSEEGLFKFLKAKLTGWQQRLQDFRVLADTGKYPGKKEIDQGCHQLKGLLEIPESYQFFEVFTSEEEDLKALMEDIYELTGFFESQREVWERLQSEMEKSFSPNREELEKDPTAKEALIRMDQILSAPRPYEMLKDTNSLIASVKSVNDRLLLEFRQKVVIEIDHQISQVREALNKSGASDDLSNQALKPLQDIKKRINEEPGIPNISYQQQKLEGILTNALDHIEKAQKKPGEPPLKPPRKIQPAKLTPKLYLESEADIEEFIEKLKSELLAALKDNPRIRIE